MAQNNKALAQGLVEGTLPKDCVAAMIYSTFPSREVAIGVGRELVARRLVGCINILTGMTSVYAWKGEIQSEEEVVLLAKVTAEGVEAAAAALNELHPYEIPALLIVPVPAAGAAYLDWLRQGTGGDI